jgi:hypothetical protein
MFILRENVLKPNIGIGALFEVLQWIIDLIATLAELTLVKRTKWQAVFITVVFVVPLFMLVYFLIMKIGS